MDDEIRVIVIATRFDDKPTASFTKPNEKAERKPGLYTEASEKAEKKEVSPSPAPTPAPAKEPEKEQEEDPFDTIFKIFNSK
jgi:cell division GTPase FtsZ